MSAAKQLNLLTASLRVVVGALNDGTVTSELLVGAYLDRIEANNIRGLGLRAVLEAAPRQILMEKAKQLDDERTRGGVRGILHGVPVLLKDTIGTHPGLGLQTTAGTIALQGSHPKGNADVVTNLLRSGAIILGKANLSVLNGFYGSNTLLGWSPRGGQVTSAFVLGSHAWGSSTGNAVALSAGFCAASIGSESNGSLVGPAARSGLYALKPGQGVVSGKGVLNVSLRLDVVAPMGKSAWDVSSLLSAMNVAGIDYTPFVEGDRLDLSSFKLGILRNGFLPDTAPVKPNERVEMYLQALERIRPAIFCDNVSIEGLSALWSAAESEDWAWKWDNGKWMGFPDGLTVTIEQYEAFAEFVEGLDDCAIHNLDQLVEWNDKHPDLAFPEGGEEDPQDILRLAAKAKGAKDAAYRSTLSRVSRIGRSVVEYMEKNSLDALVCPTITLGADIMPRGGWSSAVAISAYLPIATIPIGTISTGEPQGLALIGRRATEGKLLQIMSACEAVFPPRPVPPALLV